MRPHQWLKNAFVFAGLLFSQNWHDSAMGLRVVLAFAAFCSASQLVSGAIWRSTIITNGWCWLATVNAMNTNNSDRIPRDGVPVALHTANATANKQTSHGQFCRNIPCVSID